MTDTGLPRDGVPAFEAVLLPDRRLVRRGADRFVAIETALLHAGERPHGAVEIALRFDLADQFHRPLQRFAVLARLAVQALGEASRKEADLPIPAVEIDPAGQPARIAELMLTTSLVQLPEEPRPHICFSLAHQDHTQLQSFALPWRRAVRAVVLAVEARYLATALTSGSPC